MRGSPGIVGDVVLVLAAIVTAGVRGPRPFGTIVGPPPKGPRITDQPTADEPVEPDDAAPARPPLRDRVEARARRVGDAARQRHEVLLERTSWAQVATAVGRRHIAANGSMMAGYLAYRLFLLLLPMGAIVVAMMVGAMLGGLSVRTVRRLIERHLERTSSGRARQVLDAWDEFRPKFVKVIPRDYQRMLAAIARAEEQGLVGDEAVMMAFEENARDLSRVGGN